MTLQDRISADMKEAMKAKDKVRLAALRDIKSKIMLALTETSGADTLDDAAVTKIMAKQLKQREEPAGGRTGDEVARAVDEHVDRCGARLVQRDG